MSLSSQGPLVGLSISAITTTAFVSIAKYLEVTKATEPQSARNNEYLSWKWRNFLISFFHASFAGLMTLYCVIGQPELLTNMIGARSEAAYFLSCFSNGYFIYDLFEMMKLSYKGSLELIIHHVLVICCLTIAVWFNHYLGYSCVALVVELNNIFLHFRQLLNIAKVSKNSLVYRINCWINLGSFLVFRVFTLVWLGKCLIEHRQVVPVLIHSTASTCLVAVSIMTTIMFFRLVQADLFTKESPSPSDQTCKATTTLNGSSLSNGDSLSKESSFSNGGSPSNGSSLGNGSSFSNGSSVGRDTSRSTVAKSESVSNGSSYLKSFVQHGTKTKSS